MKPIGWILIWRKLWENKLFKPEKFSEREAWIWMIARANFKDEDVAFEDNIVHVKRGQFITSIRKLASTFLWGTRKVRKFLKKLEKGTQLRAHSPTHRYSIITIENYETYQSLENFKDTAKDTVMTTAMNTVVNTVMTHNINNINKEKKLMKNNTLSEKHSKCQKIIDLFHVHCPSLPKVAKLTDKRIKIITARLKDYPDNNFWIDLFKQIEQSDFLKNGSGTWNGANIDWIMNPNNLIKIIEGQYKNKPADSKQGEFKDFPFPLKQSTREEAEEYYAKQSKTDLH